MKLGFKMLIPYIYGKVLDELVQDESEQSTLGEFCVIYLSFIMGSLIVSTLYELISRKLEFYDEFQVYLFESILSKDIEFFDYYQTGELIGRMSKIEKIENFAPNMILR